ncbi:MAG: helix-turn-helix domain-containing protein [Spirosomataceae bacterium]
MVTKEKSSECRGAIRAIHDVMDVIGGRWKISIITCLCFQKMRFSDLLREVEGISGKVLSRELKDLEMNQLVNRTVVSTQPFAVEYSITDYGKSLKEITEVMARWGRAHRARIMEQEVEV